MKGMKVSELFPSKYLKATDIDKRGVCYTIKDGEMAEMPDGQKKAVLYFEEAPKGLVMNKTNTDTIADEYGDSMEAWVGKRIELFTVKVTVNGEQRDGIRVRVLEFDDDVPDTVAG